MERWFVKKIYYRTLIACLRKRESRLPRSLEQYLSFQHFSKNVCTRLQHLIIIYQVFNIYRRFSPDLSYTYLPCRFQIQRAIIMQISACEGWDIRLLSHRISTGHSNFTYYIILRKFVIISKHLNPIYERELHLTKI